MNDISRLKEEADIAMVVAYLGIPTYKRGSATFLLCPNPEHDDHKPTNCYYKDGWNNVYCRACGCSTNAINLIMQETGKDFSDAADLLWELEGRPEWYKQEKKKKNPVPDFRISREEAEQIGIHFPGRLLAPVGIDFGKNELPSGYEYDKKIIEPGAQEAYVRCKVNACTYRDFMSEKAYIVMVSKKAAETKESTIAIKRFLEQIQKSAGGQENLIKVAEWKIRLCNGIIKRAKHVLYLQKQYRKKSSL